MQMQAALKARIPASLAAAMLQAWNTDATSIDFLIDAQTTFEHDSARAFFDAQLDVIDTRAVRSRVPSTPYGKDGVAVYRTLLTSPEATRSGPTDVVLCWGAGIDSTLALLYAHLLGIAVDLVWVDYGQPYAQKEYDALVRMTQSLDMAEALVDSRVHIVRFMEADAIRKNQPHMPKGYIVPLRNMALVDVAQCVAPDASEVWIVANRRPANADTAGVSDKGPYFYNAMTDLSHALFGRRVVVRSPFHHLSKADSISEVLPYTDLTGKDLLDLTSSCYSPEIVDGHHRCGTCFSCVKVWLAFLSIGEDVSRCFGSHPRNAPGYSEFMEREVEKGRFVAHAECLGAGCSICHNTGVAAPE